jgi:hypothetical protein
VFFSSSMRAPSDSGGTVTGTGAAFGTVGAGAGGSDDAVGPGARELQSIATRRKPAAASAVRSERWFGRDMGAETTRFEGTLESGTNGAG